MKLGIMQPYFLPYLGYFQLLNMVDIFVVYDNIQYSKRGWIQRNRFLQNGEASMFSLPLKKDSDYLAINQRVLADTWKVENEKSLRKLKNAYKSAPNFSIAWPLIEECFTYETGANLFDFIFHSLLLISDYLDIDTRIYPSSTIAGDNASLKATNRVINLCKVLGANSYINSIGGQQLYSKEDFHQEGIDLRFIQMNDFGYPQFGQPFVSHLSIVDAMMFNTKEEIKTMLNDFTLY